MATPHDSAAPPWALRLTAEFHAADERATALARPLTRQQLNWKPAPGVWSVGQCLEHLCVANDVYLPALSNALHGRERCVVQEITPGRFGAWFIRNYIEPSAETKRTRAPRKIAPAAEVEPSVFDRFLSGNREARELIRRAAGHDVNRIRFRNPFVPLLRFTVGTGLEILARHQRRHLLQAERLRAAPEFPEPGHAATAS